MLGLPLGQSITIRVDSRRKAGKEMKAIIIRDPTIEVGKRVKAWYAEKDKPRKKSRDKWLERIRAKKKQIERDADLTHRPFAEALS